MVGIDKWFRRRRALASAVPELPELWARCAGCSAQVYKKELGQNLGVCPECGHHHRLSVEERIVSLTDPDSFHLISGKVRPTDALHFVDLKTYPERLSEYQERCGRPDAIVVGATSILGRRVVLGVLDYEFMGGSMGSVVGEEFSRGTEYALEHRLPLVMVCASGGARMQEGTLSLMQMAKTAAALARLQEARLPYIAVLTDPTTAGVTASFATLGDVLIAEPGAMIGFTGPRVIKETIREDLPEGFQRAEFLLEHGMLDMIVPRPELGKAIGGVLAHLVGE